MYALINYMLVLYCIVTLVVKNGGVLVSGSNCAVPSAADGSDKNHTHAEQSKAKKCAVCIRLIEVHGTCEYVSSEFCTCKSESETKIELENRFYIDARQTTMTFTPWMYLQDIRLSPAAVEQPGCEHFGPLFRDHSE